MRLSTLTYLAGLIAVSVYGAEPNVITLGDNEKAGEVLVLSQSNVVKLTADQKSIQGLLKLSNESKSPVVYYDDAAGGGLGFIGSNTVAYATNRTIQAVLSMPEKDATAILDDAKPMPYSKFMEKYGKNPPIPYPAVPIQVAPSILSLLLKDKPSNVILCKSAGQLFAIEVIGMAADKTSVQIKVHQTK